MFAWLLTREVVNRHRPMKHVYQHSLAAIKYNRQSTDEGRKKTKIDAMPQNKIIFKLLYNKTTLNLILKHLKLKWDIIKLTLLTLFTSKDRLHELV